MIKISISQGILELFNSADTSFSITYKGSYKADKMHGLIDACTKTIFFAFQY